MVHVDIEKIVKREVQDAERVYANGILQNDIESGNNQPFLKYVKSEKQGTFDISSPVTANVITYSLSKAYFSTLNLSWFSLPILEINFPNCRILNATDLNL